MSNADELHFVINVDYERASCFCSDEKIKYVE